MVEIFASKTAEIEEREVLHADISRKLAGECMVLLENEWSFTNSYKKSGTFRKWSACDDQRRYGIRRCKHKKIM